MSGKTNSAAKKRFKVTGTGRILHKGAGKRHKLVKKGKNRKNALSKWSQLAPGDAAKVKKLLRI